jgi:integrase
MSVRPHPRHGDGWWIIDYYPAGRGAKRIREPFRGTMGEALAYEQLLRRAPNELTNVVAPLVCDLIPAWLEYYKNEVAPSTYKDAINSLKHWLPVFGGYRVANISRSAVNGYKSSRLQEAANPRSVAVGREIIYVKKRTVTKELSYLSSCVKWAAQSGHCEELPFQIKGFSARQTTPSEPVVVLSPRQITRLYEAAEDEYKLLFLLMADMGLRREEAMSAVAEDIDEYHETLTVIGKGNKKRVLPWTTDRFAFELKRVLDERPGGHLTINPKTGVRFSQTVKALNRAARNGGLNRRVNPHVLRHSCLTNLAKQGMSPHALQQFAGHSSIETTNKIYVHIGQDFVGEEVRRIRKGGR